VRARLGRRTSEWLRPTEAWQTVETALSSPGDFRVDDDFYVVARRADPAR
jgi:hypothetical protein